MGLLSSLSFLAPWALVGLLALPALWWLLRATPPQPLATPFPPVRLLSELTNDDETPVRTPWWLIALRVLLLAALILAFAGPIWRAAAPLTLPGQADQPLLVVVETDWASAEGWQTRQAQAQRIIDTAAQDERSVAVLAAPQPLQATPLPGDSASAMAAIDGMEPQPVPQNPADLQATVEAVLDNPAWDEAAIVWMTSGVEPSASTLDWLASLRARYPLTMVQTAPPTLALSLTTGADGPGARILAIVDDAGGDARSVTAVDSAGRRLAQTPLRDAEGALKDRIVFDLPRDLRNDIARIAVLPTRHAGDVVLVDDRSDRRRVGIVGAENRDQAQPLLSGITYVERALGAVADVSVPRSGDTSGDIDQIIDEGANAIILVEVASLLPSTRARLEQWMDAGGVLVRFASTSLTQTGNALVPVPLRAVDRQLGGALTWDDPQRIAPFSATSPFVGLSVPDDVLIERQVLSEPGAALAQRTLAELEDATPLVTGDQRGEGYLVLFHITADTGWSNLPLSGLFVDMLHRLVALAPTTIAPTALQPSAVDDGPNRFNADQAPSLAPLRTLDGFGALRSPPDHVEALPVGTIPPPATVANPPGFYGLADSALAVNLFPEPLALAPARSVQWAQDGFDTLTVAADEALAFRPWLLGTVAALALADALIVLVISGAFVGMARSRRAAASLAIAALIAGALLATPGVALAQSGNSPQNETERLIAAANTTRLAYVLTGHADLDQRTREGISGLTRILAQRTAFEPGDPFAVDPERDELAFYPLIYWPMPAEPITVSDALIARIDAYMNNGGTLLFDTRDESANFTSTTISPQTSNLRRLLSALDIPPLEPVPDDHVLTKSFYLLDSFPGRFASGPLWVEALPDAADASARPARGGDGVSPIMITGNDFASAWALSTDGRPLYATSPPDRLQREYAFRTGINIGMYVMTGNYKADQVHIPALLERLVQ